jgi:hypothetical protein
VLDVGCGFGDFLAWLRARGVQPRYTGLDLTASMIERCRKRFNEGCADASAFRDWRRAYLATRRAVRYVIASGIFGYHARTPAPHQPTLGRLFSIAGAGLAVNFSTSCRGAVSASTCSPPACAVPRA